MNDKYKSLYTLLVCIIYFTVNLLFCLTESSPKPIIIKEPNTKTTLKGENVTLECQSRSSSITDISIHWRKDGKVSLNCS